MAAADWAVVALVAVGLLAFFGGIYPFRGYYFPVGPDAPVYLWWTRLAAHEGLSAVGARPGVSAVSLVLGGTLRVSRVETLAGIGVAGGVCVGLSSAALVELGSADRVSGWGRRYRAVAVGLLAGTFAVHLADGYFANLLQAALFLCAAACLAMGSWRGAVAGGALLAAGALTHPLFFLLSCGILVLTAAWTLLRRPPGVRLRDTEGGKIVAAVAGGGALAGIGLATVAVGPGPPRVDTSQDAFLRRAGLRGLLHREYRGRFVRHLARYVLPAHVPLGAIGLARTDRGSFLRRFLGTWSVVLVVGVAGSVITDAVPAVRFFAFGYVLPILAALGLVWLSRWIWQRSRPVAVVVAVGLVFAVVLGATFTWLRATPFISRTELSRAAVAARFARGVPVDTPLVFVVENERRNVSFLATRANNVIRDAVPADRIRHVFVYVGSPRNFLRGRPTLNGQLPHDAMSRLYLEDVRRVAGHPLAFVLAPFNRTYFDQAKRLGRLVARGVVVLGPHARLSSRSSPGSPSDVVPSTGWRLFTSSVLVLLLLLVAGFGWARCVAPGPAALALAPGFGAGGLILGAILLDRLGAPLTGWGPAAVSSIVAGGGYLMLLGLHRGRVHGQPDPTGDPPS